MFRTLMMLAAMLGALAVVGCAAPDRPAEDTNSHLEWRNLWSPATGSSPLPYSIHGGVGPASSSI